MHSELNRQFESSKIERRIVTRVKRRRSIDYSYSQALKSKNIDYMKGHLNRRTRYSNSFSAYDQNEAYYSQDCPNELLKEQKKDNFYSKSASDQSSKQPIQTNKKYDLNDMYAIRKDEVDFRKYNYNFQLDVLQLEALYYWLSIFGFQRSAPLQIPPYLCQYIYSLILYRSDFRKILIQYMDIYSRAYRKFNLIVNFYLNSFIHKLNLDYEVLLDDFLKYFQLSNLQNDKIEQSLKEDYIYRKNNIALGNIRFFFKQKDRILVDFQQPIGKFEDQQFYDYVQFQTEFGKQLSQYESIKSFNQHLTEPHSERTLILFLLADIELNKSIYKTLNQDLINQGKIGKIDNLTKIYLEITTESRLCSRCVIYLQKIQVNFYFNVDQKFQFIIISQYLLDPQIEQEVEKYQKIWIRTPQGQQIQQQQTQKQFQQNFQTDSNYQADIYLENFLENFQAPKQKENLLDSQSVPKEDLQNMNLYQQIEQEEIKEQELLVCYEEQEPTGFVSFLLLKERYCVGNCRNFKEKVDQIKITNTFFLSNGKQEEPKQNSQSSEQEIKQQFANLLKEFSNIKQEKQFQVQNKFQKHQQTFITQEDLLLETRSQFYKLLVKKFTSEFSELNTQQFNLNTILSIYWGIGSLQGFKESHTDLIDALKEELRLNSIIQCGKLNMQLFLSDYTFLREFITPQISRQIRRKNENLKFQLIFVKQKYLVKKTLANDCNSLSLLIEQQVNTVIKKFKNILIIILSVDRIQQQCKERINSQILSFHHSNLELKYFSIKQKEKQQMQQSQQKQSQILEQEWDLLEIEYYKQRYTLQKEGLFLSYKQLSENVDEELFSFECQIHSQNINM
ncbi:unnamed protein product [Paramecium primaurelia]|uniref:Uncharacterized protein n=1 Tax=Paramecium primaurelia TaxID=5886 RepID=A0A8S1QX55_PARPR|nr:unnamed protein product [Paramecium primaurelia]